MFNQIIGKNFIKRYDFNQLDKVTVLVKARYGFRPVRV